MDSLSLIVSLLGIDHFYCVCLVCAKKKITAKLNNKIDQAITKSLSFMVTPFLNLKMNYGNK